MISYFNGPKRAQGYAMMRSTTASHAAPVDESFDVEVVEFWANFETRSPLDEIIREGARRMLQAAIDAEVEEFIIAHADRCDEQGRRQVVRDGRLPSRPILSGAGPLEVSQPRVRDKFPRKEKRVTFSPSVLRRSLRRTKAVVEPVGERAERGIDSLAVQASRRATSQRRCSRSLASRPRG